MSATSRAPAAAATALACRRLPLFLEVHVLILLFAVVVVLRSNALDVVDEVEEAGREDVPHDVGPLGGGELRQLHRIRGARCLLLREAKALVRAVSHAPEILFDDRGEVRAHSERQVVLHVPFAHHLRGGLLDVHHCRSLLHGHLQSAVVGSIHEEKHVPITYWLQYQVGEQRPAANGLTDEVAVVHCVLSAPLRGTDRDLVEVGVDHLRAELLELCQQLEEDLPHQRVDQLLQRRVKEERL
mmetsp:Transcript_14207/g.55922  ORF Transcript_14207/g.55922 Transcript_14207/m.55922 type:complete len:242 (-) Transcript_14207:2549-3274(-)